MEIGSVLGDRYEIRERIGEGGMATVYLADDRKHHRQVAVKVLRPELAAALGPERFLREIEISASLRHPHILPLYDSGEADGFLYYVMPYAAGDSLRDRLEREKQLPIEDALSIASEVADALHYAHDQGVVHRDIKPENILLESGHAVVTDFGIAWAVAEAGGTRLTETGLSIGTPTYMSPEQASGSAEIDGRSDIYALGTVLYETLAGEPPFDGPTAQAIVAKTLTEDVPALKPRRSTVSQETEAAITKALAKVPADRFASAAEFAKVLRGLTTSGMTPSRTTPLRSRRVTPVIGAVVIVLAGLAAWLTTRGGGPPTPAARPSIAVLPFENRGSPDDEYFADGITEEMTSRLAEISGLRVTARTSTLRYKGTTRDIREIGAELGVDYVLEGAVRTDRAEAGAGQVRVTPQLIAVSDNSLLWTVRYNASLVPGEIFAVQAEIAEQVASALNVTLLGSERAALGATLTVDPEAYEAYLLGRFHWNKRQSADLLRAEEYFSRAIELDSMFVQAYVGLSDTYTLFELYNLRTIPFEEAYARAEAAARRALALDSTNAGAYASLGFTLTFGQWDLEGGEAAFRQAMALDPEYPPTYLWYAQLLMYSGDVEGGVREASRAVELDPTSAVARTVLSIGLIRARRFEEAASVARASVDLDPAYAPGRRRLADALRYLGEREAAAAQYSAGGYSDSVVTMIMGLGGDPAERTRSLEIARRRLREGMPVAQPTLLTIAELGEIDEALDLIESYLTRNFRSAGRSTLPEFDRFRSHPRYLEIVRRLGIRP